MDFRVKWDQTIITTTVGSNHRRTSDEDTLKLYHEHMIVRLGCRKEGLEIKLPELSLSIIILEAYTTMLRSEDRT